MGVETTLPKISIVTPSYNQGKYLEKTILSVLEQGYPNLEYIIIDGGSTDESVDIIKKYSDRLTYWVSEPDRGQSHAINKGFERATGEIFGWLNSDDLYSNNTLSRVARINWQRADFCFGEGVWIDADGITLHRYPTIFPTKLTLKSCCTLCQPTVFFSKRTYRELGPFSLEYHNSFDYEYWLRAVSNGKTFKYIPRVLAESRMHLENKTLKNQQDICLENEKLISRYYRGGEYDELLKAQIDVVVFEYTKFMERKLIKTLELRYNGYFWSGRTIDGWIKHSAKVVFNEKIKDNAVWYAEISVPSYNLPTTIFFYNRYVTKRLEFHGPYFYRVPLSDMIIDKFRFGRPYIKVYSEKLFSPLDYMDSDDIRELGILVNIVKDDRSQHV